MLRPYPAEGGDIDQDDWISELHQRVEWWQERLLLLGVRHFRIEAVELNEAPQGRRTATAGVNIDSSYDSCNFQFHIEQFTELTPREMDEVIVHEWLHVAFRDMTHAIGLIDDHLSNSVQDIWDDAVDHAEETLIDRIARQIVFLVHSNT